MLYSYASYLGRIIQQLTRIVLDFERRGLNYNAGLQIYFLHHHYRLIRRGWPFGRLVAVVGCWEPCQHESLGGSARPLPPTSRIETI